MLRDILFAASLFLLYCGQNVQALQHTPLHDQRQTSAFTSHAKRQPGQEERHFFKFVTRPDIDAPTWKIDVHDENATAPGYWFVAPYNGLDQIAPGDAWVGPHIYDSKGDLIWSGAAAFKHWNVYDFKPATVNGEQMLSLLSYHEHLGYILDNSYHVHKVVPMLSENETNSNMHAFRIIDDGRRALMLNLRPWGTPMEMSQKLGYDGYCDAKYQGFREVDLENGNFDTLFEWDGRHIGLDESTVVQHDGTIQEMCEKGWDNLHLNSVAKFPDGDYIISARHTDAIYKISHRTGRIVWRLGGTKSDFKFVGESAHFSRQHHALVRDHNHTHTVLTLFDNAIGDGANDNATNQYSRGLVMSLDRINMTAEVIAEYADPKGHRTNARGSYQTLPNGNAFLCWAYQSRISEHTPDGRVAMEATLHVQAHTYRAFKYPWVGRPTQPPDVHTEAVFNGKDIMTIIHMSWNGATDVAKWKVSQVIEDSEEKQIGVVDRQGFETVAHHRGFAGQIYVEAVDSKGEVLGKSEVVTTARPRAKEAGDEADAPHEHAVDVEKAKSSSILDWDSAATPLAGEPTIPESTATDTSTPGGFPTEDATPTPATMENSFSEHLEPVQNAGTDPTEQSRGWIPTHSILKKPSVGFLLGAVGGMLGGVICVLMLRFKWRRRGWQGEYKAVEQDRDD